MPRRNHPKELPQATKRGRYKPVRAVKRRKMAKMSNILSVALPKRRRLQRLQLSIPDPNTVIRDLDNARRRGDISRWMF